MELTKSHTPVKNGGLQYAPPEITSNQYYTAFFNMFNDSKEESVLQVRRQQTHGKLLETASKILKDTEPFTNYIEHSQLPLESM